MNATGVSHLVMAWSNAGKEKLLRSKNCHDNSDGVSLGWLLWVSTYSIKWRLLLSPEASQEFLIFQIACQHLIRTRRFKLDTLPYGQNKKLLSLYIFHRLSLPESRETKGTIWKRDPSIPQLVANLDLEWPALPNCWLWWAEIERASSLVAIHSGEGRLTRSYSLDICVCVKCLFQNE